MRPQARKVLGLLQAAGTRGVHSHELRKQLIGNPSQRIAEIEGDGYTVAHRRERSPFGTKTYGTLYILEAEPSVRRTAAAPAASELVREQLDQAHRQTELAQRDAASNHYALDLFS